VIFLSNTTNIPDPHRASRVLHRALLGGLVVISTVFLVLGLMDVAPLIRDAEGVAIIGYLLAGIGLLPIIVGMLVLRPRVPRRGSGQSEAEYWQGALGPAMLVWTLTEAGGIMCAVGALITGLWAPMVVVAVALTCLGVTGPGHFENE